jgi:hypothetical protein
MAWSGGKGEAAGAALRGIDEGYRKAALPQSALARAFAAP